MITAHDISRITESIRNSISTILRSELYNDLVLKKKYFGYRAGEIKVQVPDSERYRENIEI